MTRCQANIYHGGQRRPCRRPTNHPDGYCCHHYGRRLKLIGSVEMQPCTGHGMCQRLLEEKFGKEKAKP